jgi:hypothetical protein
VTLDFPLAGTPALTATVERWLPPPREGAAGDDIAGLVLEGAPEGTAAVRLAVDVPVRAGPCGSSATRRGVSRDR